MQLQQVEIKNIIVDEKIQQRVCLNEEYIVELSREIADGVVMPPLDVYDIDGDLKLTDGLHRFEAYRQAGIDTIEVNIYKGTERDAILHAVGTNATHGLRRTNADKRKAVTTLLKDKEWGSLSDGQIAEICRVSQPFVSKVSNELTQNGFERSSQRLGKDGRLTDTANVGAKGQNEEYEDSQPIEEVVAPRAEAETNNTDENEETHSSEGNDAESPPDAESEDAADVAFTDNNNDDDFNGGADESKPADNEDLSPEPESLSDPDSANESKVDDESSDQNEEGNSGSDGNDSDGADESTSTAIDEEDPIPSSHSMEQPSQEEDEERETDSGDETSSEEATDDAGEDNGPLETEADYSQTPSVDVSQKDEVQTLKAKIAELVNAIAEKNQRIEELEEENAELQRRNEELEEQLQAFDDYGKLAEELSDSAMY